MNLFYRSLLFKGAWIGRAESKFFQTLSLWMKSYSMAIEMINALIYCHILKIKGYPQFSLKIFFRHSSLTLAKDKM